MDRGVLTPMKVFSLRPYAVPSDWGGVRTLRCDEKYRMFRILVLIGLLMSANIRSWTVGMTA